MLTVYSTVHPKNQFTNSDLLQTSITTLYARYTTYNLFATFSYLLLFPNCRIGNFAFLSVLDLINVSGLRSNNIFGFRLNYRLCISLISIILSHISCMLYVYICLSAVNLDLNILYIRGWLQF